MEISTFVIASLFLLAYVSFCAAIAIRKDRADLADIAWGPGFALVGWVAFAFSPFSYKALIVNLLITLWGVRLALQLFYRAKVRKEDFRYRKLKEKWGRNRSLRMFLDVFLLQGVILYVIALPLLKINIHPSEQSFLGLWECAVVWLLGFAVEAISDFHLYRFKKDRNNQDKILKTGLWGYSRHPNYIGEMMQWWAIWALSGSVPLLISPLLLMFLLIKISGAAPLEEKMKKHPEFEEYVKKTPSWLPSWIVNALIYNGTWVLIVVYGSKGSFWIPFAAATFNYGFQMALFSKQDRKSYALGIPLSLYALVLGFIQETGFIHFSILDYKGEGIFPPFWIVCLYPLFSLTLNSSLSFLNKSRMIPFFVGGAGALISYSSGKILGAVDFVSPYSFFATFISWGLILTILIELNHHLLYLYEKYAKNLEEITVFFDGKCPVCAREMRTLKQRKQTGLIVYASPSCDQELSVFTSLFSYAESMKTIHAMNKRGEVMTGTKALSEVYARTNLLTLAIFLQAPLFRQIFCLLYSIWAKLRIRKED